MAVNTKKVWKFPDEHNGYLQCKLCKVLYPGDIIKTFIRQKGCCPKCYYGKGVER